MTTRRWLLPGLAAGAVVLVAAGTAVGLSGRDDDPAAAGPGVGTSAAAAPTTGAAAPAVPATDPADLLVRDGTQVVVSGQVLALPGRPVRMCAPLAVAAPGYEPGTEPLPDYCEGGVTVRGLDLAAISERKLDRGVVTGRARVEGRYAAGVVTVARQAAPDPEVQRPSSLPERPPCAPPPGGWQPTGQPVEIDPLTAYLTAHPDQYVDPWITYPGGHPATGDGSTPYPAVSVPVVGTVLDPAAAEPALRKVHPGNLCVVRVPRSAATLKAVTDRLTRDDTGWREHRVYETGPDPIAGTVDVSLVVLDPAAQRWLRQADDRTGAVRPHPWVRPLR